MEEHVIQCQKDHLDCAMKTIMQLKKDAEGILSQVNELVHTVEECQSAVEVCRQTPPLTLYIRGLSTIKTSNPCYSLPFYSSARGHKMRVCATPSRSIKGIALSIEVIPGGMNDSYLVSPCEGKVTYQVIHKQTNMY